jgi:hypothetical protein
MESGEGEGFFLTENIGTNQDLNIDDGGTRP